MTIVVRSAAGVVAARSGISCVPGRWLELAEPLPDWVQEHMTHRFLAEDGPADLGSAGGCIPQRRAAVSQPRDPGPAHTARHRQDRHWQAPGHLAGAGPRSGAQTARATAHAWAPRRPP